MKYIQLLYRDFQFIRRQANQPLDGVISHGRLHTFAMTPVTRTYGEARARLPCWLLWLAEETAYPRKR